jgi:hypothetical protein
MWMPAMTIVVVHGRPNLRHGIGICDQFMLFFDLIFVSNHRDSHPPPPPRVDFNDSDVSCNLFSSCSISLYVCALLGSLLALPTKARILCSDSLYEDF